MNYPLTSQQLQFTSNELCKIFLLLCKEFNIENIRIENYDALYTLDDIACTLASYFNNNQSIEEVS